MSVKPRSTRSPNAKNAKSNGSKKPTGSRKSTSGSAKRSTSVRVISTLIKMALAASVVLAVGAIYLGQKVRTKFEGKRWSVPAKVYAQPLELFPGSRLSASQLVRELKRLRYSDDKQIPGSFYYEENGQRTQSIAVNTRGFQFWDGNDPPERLSIRFRDGRIDAIRHRDSSSQRSGSSVAIVRLEPLLIGGIYPKHNEDRELVRLEEVPEELINTLLAIEDRDFASHFGISLKGVARAVFVNVSSGALRQGGSTLTQQLVKNFYLTNQRSLSRKVREAVMAVLLELHYDKEEILEAYLNEVYLGQAGAKAIHGFGLASQFYFAQPLNNLQLHQTALLVALVKGPSYYDPRRHPERAKERRDQVIDSLLELEQITPQQAADYKKRRLGVIDIEGGVSGRTYPAFMDLLKRQLIQDYREEDLNSEGLRIFTTMNPFVQQSAELAVSKTVKTLQDRGDGLGGVLEAALVVSDPENGELLALVGGKDSRFAGFNRAVDAVRQVGSVIKPAVYLAALEKGHHFGEFIDDIPISIKNPNGSVWSPQNYEKKSNGTILLQEGLVHSYNLATVRLGLDIGVNAVVDVLKRGGITRPLNRVPSLFLGAADLTPLEVTGFYQAIAGNGFSSPLRTIREVTTSEGEPLARYPLRVEHIFDGSDVYMLTRVMQSAVSRGTGRRLYSRLSPALQVAGKTGTTNNQRDSWFVGITGNYLGVAWVGRDDNGSTRLTGASGALAVWTELMAAAQPEPLTPLQPQDVLDVWIDTESGKLSAKDCYGAMLVPMRIDDLPPDKTTCAYNAEDRASGWRHFFDEDEESQTNSDSKESRQEQSGSQSGNSERSDSQRGWRRWFKRW